MSDVPEGLGVGGSALWALISEAHPDLDPAQGVTLLEACRAKDRLDKLDDVLRGDTDTWVRLYVDPRSDDGTVLEVRVTQALAQANATANLMKQLLAALRLPDAASGKRPQQRGGARGSYAPKGAAPVSSIERARARKSG